MRQVFISLLLLFFIGHKTSAQNFSNKGTEFWTVFAPHEPGSSTASANKMTLFFTTDTATTVTVTIGGVQVTGSPVSLTPGVISSLDINVSNRLASPEGLYTQKGINIKSTKNIVAYAQIYGSSVAGASVLFPLQTLGRSYTSLNYKQISNETDARSFCVVVATEDNTTVQVNPSGLTEGGTLVPNQFNTTTNQKTLNKGDCWLIQGKVVSSASTSNVDLTGTQIRSVSNSSGACKPIAVFCGSSKISITCSNSSASSDNLFQQAFPKAAWGKKYVSAPTAGTNYNYNVYRVMLDPDAGTTTVKINGITLPSTVAGLGTATTPTGIGTNTISLITTANGTNYYEFVTSIPVNIEATNPIMVAQYITNKSNCSNNYSPNAGDPDMIYLSPVEQTIDKITVAPVPTSNSSASNYVNVVMKTADVSSFQIRNQSGTLLTSSFNPITANPLYSYSQIALANGYSSTTYYTLSTTNSSGFNAVAYGYDQSESYAYNAGTNVKNLYQSINSNNPNSTVANSTICKNTPTLLSITLPFLPTSFIWDFNSNPKITPNANVTRPTPVTYDSTYTIDGKDFYVFKMPSLTTFTEAGVYPIKIIVNNPTPDGCDGTQTITFDVNVYNGPKASFSTSSNFCVNNILSFTNNSTDSIGRPLVRWEWDFGDTQTDNTQNTSHAYAIANTYNVSMRVYNDYGCYSDTTKQVTIVPKPSTPIVTTPINYCQNETASLLNATGNNLLWYTSSSGGFGSTTTPIPITSAFGTNFYYVTQTINNCESDRAEIIVNINAIPSAPVLSVVNNCGNSTLTASGITGTITWSDGGSGNPRNVTNSASYSLTQTVNGCTSSSSNIVTTNPTSIPSAPTLSVTDNCGNSTLTASGITGTITWSDGGNGNPRTVTNSASYSLSQTANGCTSSFSNTVTTNPTSVPSAPTLSVTNNCGNSTLTASGITGTITWSDGGNGNPRTVTNSASYSLTQTVNGCTSNSSNIITTNPTPAPSAPVLSVVNNCGNSTLTASGITGTIIWSDGGNGNPRTVTNSASYSLTQSVNGCTSSSSNIVTTAPITIPPAPVLSVVNDCGISTLTASGIVGHINWSDGGNGNPRTVTINNSYSLTQNIGKCTSAVSNVVTSAPLVIPNPPVLSIINNCGNSTITASNVTGILTWNDGGTGNPRTVTINNSYSVSQTVGGCTSSLSNIVVSVPKQIPSPPILSVLDNCGSSTLTANNIVGTLTWNDGGSGNPRTVNNAASFSLTQNLNGCESSTSNVVTTNPKTFPPAPNVTSPISYCQNTTATALTAIGSNILWYNIPTGGIGSSTTPIPSTNTQGFFNFYASQTVNGCESNLATIQVNILALPTPANISPTGLIEFCDGKTITLHSSYATGNQWLKNGNELTGAINDSLVVTTSGDFSIKITNTDGCQSISNIVTTILHPLPSVFAGADKYIYEGDSTQLNATASGGLLFSYKWNPKVYLTSDTILKPWTIKPPFDISYKLTVTNEKGCSSSDDVLVHVINKLIIPNVFSPNGDKVNDTWEIKNINTNPFCTVDVYDRNGQVVYHSGGYSKPWDGTYHGKNVPNGVYYYIISEGKNVPLKSGTVTLLR